MKLNICLCTCAIGNLTDYANDLNLTEPNQNTNEPELNVRVENVEQNNRDDVPQLNNELPPAIFEDVEIPLGEVQNMLHENQAQGEVQNMLHEDQVQGEVQNMLNEDQAQGEVQNMLHKDQAQGEVQNTLNEDQVQEVQNMLNEDQVQREEQNILSEDRPKNVNEEPARVETTVDAPRNDSIPRGKELRNISVAIGQLGPIEQNIDQNPPIYENVELNAADMVQNNSETPLINAIRPMDVCSRIQSNQGHENDRELQNIPPQPNPPSHYVQAERNFADKKIRKGKKRRRRVSRVENILSEVKNVYLDTSTSFD